MQKFPLLSGGVAEPISGFGMRYIFEGRGGRTNYIFTTRSLSRLYWIQKSNGIRTADTPTLYMIRNYIDGLQKEGKFMCTEVLNFQQKPGHLRKRENQRKIVHF